MEKTASERVHEWRMLHSAPPSEKSVHGRNAGESSNFRDTGSHPTGDRAHPRARHGRSDPEAWSAKASAVSDFFRKFAHETSTNMGRPWAFVIAFSVILAWAITGPLFRFSDTWQLVINTGTTIVTFLMVFLIQNTQNRDAVALHLKIDELIRAVKGARNQLIDVEELSDGKIATLQAEFRKLSAGTPASHPYVEDDRS